MFRNLKIVLVTGSGIHGEFGPVQANIVSKTVTRGGGEVFLNKWPEKTTVTHIISNRDRDTVRRLLRVSLKKESAKLVRLSWFSNSVTGGCLLPEAPHEIPHMTMTSNNTVIHSPPIYMPRKDKLSKIKIESSHVINNMIDMWKARGDDYRVDMWVDVRRKYNESDDGNVTVNEGVRRCLMGEINL